MSFYSKYNVDPEQAVEAGKRRGINDEYVITQAAELLAVKIQDGMRVPPVAIIPRIIAEAMVLNRTASLNGINARLNRIEAEMKRTAWVKLKDFMTKERHLWHSRTIKN